MWAAGIIVALVLLVAAGLWLAVWHNGPAVVDRIDRLTGPVDTVDLVHREQLGDDPRQKLLVYRPEPTDRPLPVVIFVHGGGWHSGDPDDYGFIARNIAAQGYVAVLAGYRLGQAGRYPAMLEDTASAIGWTHAQIARFGGDPARIVLAGHSAGAYNVVQVALDPRWLAQQQVPRVAIRGVIGLAGPYDFYPFDKDSSRAAFGSVGADATSQPVNHARAEAPPMLLVHGEDDTVVRPRNTRALAAALEAKGASVETLYLSGKGHNEPLLHLANPWRRDPQVFDRAMKFLREHTAVSVPVQAE